MEKAQGSFRLFSRIFTATTLALLSCAALPASSQKTPPAPQPTEVKIVSVPLLQPTEVKIVSVPAATPAEVKILSAPPDESADKLVTGTWVLVIVNVVLVLASIALCVVTYCVSRNQSRDLKESDLWRMRRAANRAANQIMVMATRLDQSAAEVLAVRGDLNTLIGGVPPEVEGEIREVSACRHARLIEIVDGALAIATGSVNAMSEKELKEHLMRLDARAEQLEGMRDSINKEREGYEKDALIVQSGTAQAALVTRRLKRPRATT
jgi:hypothetical protein